MVEEWLTFNVGIDNATHCDTCSRRLCGREVHLHVNSYHDIDEVLCENCYKIAQEEDE